MPRGVGRGVGFRYKEVAQSMWTGIRFAGEVDEGEVEETEVEICEGDEPDVLVGGLPVGLVDTARAEVIPCAITTPAIDSRVLLDDVEGTRKRYAFDALMAAGVRGGEESARLTVSMRIAN
jgi:hypothetical protein